MEPDPLVNANLSSGKRRTLMMALDDLCAADIKDETLSRLLADADEDTTKYSDVLAHLRQQLVAARKSILFSGQNDGANIRLSESYRERESLDILLCWQSLISDSIHVAEALNLRYQDNMDTGYYRRLDGGSVRALHASYVVDALRLVLLARWCQIRALVNFQVIDEIITTKPLTSPTRVLRRFRICLKQYDLQVRQWRLTRVQPRGTKDAVDATNFGVWRIDFGRVREDEPGWGPFARAVAIHLGYEALHARLKQGYGLLLPRFRLASLALLPIWPALILAANLLLLADVFLRFVTFVALHPLGSFGLAALMIPLYASLNVADALLFPNASLVNVHACHQIGTLSDIPWLLYYSTVTLTSLGPDTLPCGQHVHVLITVETLTGYFLIPLIAALFYSWFTER